MLLLAVNFRASPQREPSAAVLSAAERRLTPGAWQHPLQGQAPGFAKRGRGSRITCGTSSEHAAVLAETLASLLK